MSRRLAQLRSALAGEGEATDVSILVHLNFCAKNVILIFLSEVGFFGNNLNFRAKLSKSKIAA